MKILVIDDSKAIRMLIRECVTAMGHEVIDAEPVWKLWPAYRIMTWIWR